MKKHIFYITLLISPVTIASTTYGINYIEGGGANSRLSVCATTSTPLPIFVATLRDFGLSSEFRNRLSITVDANFYTEKERGVAIKSANFFSMETTDKPVKPKQYSILEDYGKTRPVSPLPMSTRQYGKTPEYNAMSTADGGIGLPTEHDQQRYFEPYYSQIRYIRDGSHYKAVYSPKQQFRNGSVRDPLRQPDDIIWLPGRAIKSLTITILDLQAPAAPAEYKGKPAPSVTFVWKAKTGYNPKSFFPPILELVQVSYAGDDNPKWGTVAKFDEQINRQQWGNAAVSTSITLGDSYTVDLTWNRSPVIRDIVSNSSYGPNYLAGKNAFGGDVFNANVMNFPKLHQALKNNQKLSRYDINLKKLDFIYANIDALTEPFPFSTKKSAELTYFRGSINAYNNVYFDENKNPTVNTTPIKVCD